MSKLLKVLNYVLTILFVANCSTTFSLRKSSSPNSKPETIQDHSPSTQQESLEKPSKSASAASVRQTDLPLVRNSSTEKWIRYFQTTAHRSFIRWRERGESFRESIEEALVQKGVPSELYYVSLIESGFVHHASSTAAAVGPWQFIRDTGARYGLKINDWIDQRRDPVRSTQAAAALLRDLHARFGDWYLALAAYNGGPRTIDEAIKKGHTRDFWQLKSKGLLKKETGEFVPKLLAAVIIASDPVEFGFPATLVQAYASFPSTTIKIKRPIKMDELSKKLAIPLEQLKQWNPELLRGITPPKRFLNQEGYALRIAEPFVKKFAEIQPELKYLQVKDIRIHKISKGDTIAKLAKRYHVSVQTVLQINPQLRSRGMVEGMKVAMPVPETAS